MELFTIQLSQWRIAKQLAIPLLDTTVKTGEKTFSPTWNLVTRIKAGAIDENAYRAEYFDIMRQSYVKNTLRWHEVVTMDKVAIACYCPPNCFCHRHLLKEIFEKVCMRQGLPFLYSGELT